MHLDPLHSAFSCHCLSPCFVHEAETSEQEHCRLHSVPFSDAAVLDIVALNHFTAQVVKAYVISAESAGSSLCHDQDGNYYTKISHQEENIYLYTYIFSMYIYKLVDSPLKLYVHLWAQVTRKILEN